jgi:hypothetical protein
MNETFMLTLQEKDISLIINQIAELPYKQVYQLIANIQSQVGSQLSKESTED